nr:hypothetical protein [uncultured Porphyromonas sp.]
MQAYHNALDALLRRRVLVEREDLPLWRLDAVDGDGYRHRLVYGFIVRPRDHTRVGLEVQAVQGFVVEACRASASSWRGELLCHCG